MGEKMTEQELFGQWWFTTGSVFSCDKEMAWRVWQARAHLTQPAQAVDVEKVREERDSQQRAAIAAMDRAERAETLLRECVAAHTGENIEGCDMSDADVARITAHLSENSRG